MRKVRHYKIKARGVTRLRLPLGSEVLGAQAQGDSPVLHVEVPVAEGVHEEVRIAAVVEGQEAPPGGQYLGTLVLDDGEFVANVFRVP
jgi:hypothetical protein